ncbi:hypothetical protein PACTADRAFT_38892 [Pachysolen tannophilus NRRL Y-2460]|uniref:AP complex subunit sigma n=1 Tax=Pachysolen tannophilus NRRL Y-2460 TaxID=669874 RepID=A0A1E4TZL2_PACTA|nr:hypothetical protein PACTADRAFT_38892 [Pachysolen tannophilus NRRL Y-2460]
MAIQYILVLNRQGKVRLSKWFNNSISEQEKFKIKNSIHRLLSSRDNKHQSNFVEFEKKKLCYRRYAGLYFIMCVDLLDNELYYLESIHFFVEVLDSFFNNVCELDLVFNFYKVYAIMDEVFMAGEIEEISKEVILNRVAYLERLD